MGKCFIDFSVIQQDLRRTDKNTVAADAAETVAARFDLGSKWDGLNVYARYQHGPEVYDVPLVDGCATIPHEVLRETGFNVSVFGESADGARLTSARVFVDVEPTISNDGAPPIPATPSLLQRIDALVHASSESARNAAESAQVAQEANAATVEIDGVDTLPAGSAATVANVGTQQDARLRFGIPKGDKGDKGSGGGVPEGGVPGQVIVKTETGEGWTDANAHGHDAADITSGTMSADRLPVSSIAKGGTGGTTAREARNNLLSGTKNYQVDSEDLENSTVKICAIGNEGSYIGKGNFGTFSPTKIKDWILDKVRSVFGFSDANSLGIANGGTGASTAEGARANLGVDLETLGAARAEHAHDASEIGGVISIEHGGTGNSKGFSSVVFMIGSLGMNHTLSAKQTYERLMLVETIGVNCNGFLEISSGGIKCLKSGIVRLRANARFEGPQATGAGYIKVTKNDSRIVVGTNWSTNNVASAGQIVIPDCAVAVDENDVLYLEVYCGGGTPTFAGVNFRNHLSVEYVYFY